MWSMKYTCKLLYKSKKSQELLCTFFAYHFSSTEYVCLPDVNERFFYFLWKQLSSIFWHKLHHNVGLLSVQTHELCWRLWQFCQIQYRDVQLMRMLRKKTGACMEFVFMKYNHEMSDHIPIHKYSIVLLCFFLQYMETVFIVMDVSVW